MLHPKRIVGKYSPPLDSPAYDGSEEDNDPLTDDAASTISPTPAIRHPPPSSSHSRPPNSIPLPPRNAALSAMTAASSRTKHHLASSHLHSDDGVDSPTYDGDIESSTTAGGPDLSSPSYLLHSKGYHPQSSSTSTLNTPMSPGFPSDVSSANSTPGLVSVVHDPLAKPHSAFLSAQVNAAPVPLQVPQEPSPAGVSDTATFTPEDIRRFVQDAIIGDPNRSYKINPPPVDRPVRIYADGVYDLFHFGHSLQLRQAKLSFPSVYLLVGVCSDELVKQHKFRSVMNHAERCESARHCRWVDEIVPEAPWIIDCAFLEKWKIDYVAHDEDPYIAEGHKDVYALVKSQGKFIPTRRTPGISTSELLERIVTGYRRRDFDQKLEKMGHRELRAEGSDYDSLGSSRVVSRSISPMLAVPDVQTVPEGEVLVVVDQD